MRASRPGLTEGIRPPSVMAEPITKRGQDMETFTQPKITGYRQLNEEEAALMNEIKAEGVRLGELVEKLRALTGLDQRWVSIGATDLQTGLMALSRAVAQPTTF